MLEQEIVNRDTLSVIVRKKQKIDVSKIKESYDVVCKEINDYVDALKKQGKKVAIWGASHQGFTLAATAKLTKKIEYAPASHIPIISPADELLHSVDAIIIMAPGYTDEIAAIIKRDFGQGTEIAVMKAKNLQMYEDIKQ